MSIKGCNSVANLLKFKPIQAFVHVLVTCKNEEIQFKIKALECSQDFSHYKSMEIFPDAQGQLTAVHGRIWSNFELVQDFMVVLITCKNEEDPIKKESSSVFTTLYINFSDTQGQKTLGLVVVSGRI